MHDQHEQVPVWPGADQRGPHQRPGGQIERLAPEAGGDRLGLPSALAVVERRLQLDALDRHRAGIGDDLLGDAVEGDDPRPQHGVARDQGVHRPLERLPVERAVEPDRIRHVERRFAGLELLEEPQPLLRERRGEAHCGPTSRRRRPRPLPGQRPSDRRRACGRAGRRRTRLGCGPSAG
jgi:hypothetical protein